LLPSTHLAERKKFLILKKENKKEKALQNHMEFVNLRVIYNNFNELKFP
jgi:hypothetical protein